MTREVIRNIVFSWINLGYIEENTIWTDPYTGRKYKRYFDGREVEINDDF